jgi:hypothetical protein
MPDVSDRLLAAHQAVSESAEDLVDAVDSLFKDADFKSIFALAHAHGFMYRGPDITKQMHNAINAINGLRAVKHDEEPVVKAAPDPDVIDVQVSPAGTLEEKPAEPVQE